MQYQNHDNITTLPKSFNIIFDTVRHDNWRICAQPQCVDEMYNNIIYYYLY